MTVVRTNLKLVTGFVTGENYGTSMNSNLDSIDIASPVSIKAYGAKGDGTTDDTSAISAAISAAEAAYQNAVVFFPPSSSDYISSTGGFVIKRSTVISGYGATLKLTSATAVLFRIGSGSQNDTAPGGIYGLNMIGNAGASDTSIGVQLGSGSINTYMGVTLRDCRILSFGNGIYVTGTEAGSGSGHVDIDNCRITLNAFNGIKIDSTTSAIEQLVIQNTFINQNGLTQATGTGIQVLGSGKAALTLAHCTIHSNGNGTLASMIHAVGTTTGNLYMVCVNGEVSGTQDASLIILTGSGSHRLYATNCSFAQFGNAKTKPILKVASSETRLLNCRFEQQIGGTVVPCIDLGAGQTSEFHTLAARNCQFKVNGTVANGQVLAVTGSGNLTTFDITGTTLSGYQTATALTSIPADTNGTHDLLTPGWDYATGWNTLMTGLRIGDTADNTRRIKFDTIAIPASTTRTIFVLDTDSQGHIKTPVVATASLPAAGAAQDGKVLIEDAGAGDRNIIIYGGGQRFRIDGGASF